VLERAAAAPAPGGAVAFFFTQKRGRQQAFASLFASYAAILFYVLSQKSPLKPFKASIINSASAN